MITISAGFNSAFDGCSSSSAAWISAASRCVAAQPGASVASRCAAAGARSSGESVFHSSKLTIVRAVRSKATTATSSAGAVLRSTSSAFVRASSQSFSRRMLALVSTRITTRLPAPATFASPGSSCWTKGRAKPSASSATARQRSSSSQRFSSRLRRVTRGGVGWRNMSVLKGVTSFVVRRMRWKRIGPMTASAPRAKRGARKFMRGWWTQSSRGFHKQEFSCRRK